MFKKHLILKQKKKTHKKNGSQICHLLIESKSNFLSMERRGYQAWSIKTKREKGEKHGVE